jgi:energy-coupling factor transport system permease protein
MSTDKLIYLLGRIFPKLSLFISIMLRCIPRIHQQGNRIRLAQKSIGRGIGQGNVLRRIRNLLRIEHILITWSIENFIQVSESMKNRGYTLKRRTAFSIYRFDYRDRSFVVSIFFCITIIIMAVLLDQTDVQYNPEIILNNVTSISYVFYITYAFVCLLPMNLQIISERKFNKLIDKKAF